MFKVYRTDAVGPSNVHGALQILAFRMKHVTTLETPGVWVYMCNNRRWNPSLGMHNFPPSPPIAGIDVVHGRKRQPTWCETHPLSM